MAICMIRAAVLSISTEVDAPDHGGGQLFPTPEGIWILVRGAVTSFLHSIASHHDMIWHWSLLHAMVWQSSSVATYNSSVTCPASSRSHLHT